MKWIVADSGSSKTDWVVLENNIEIKRIHTAGINPLFMPQQEIESILNIHFTAEKNDIKNLIFYGAGLSAIKAKTLLNNIFQDFFVNATVDLQRDIIGAIRCATFEKINAIIGILGTGSNTCVFHDFNQIQVTETLGYVLGDEGSGNALGKRLLQLFFYKKLPHEIHDKLFKEFNLNKADIIQKVYNEAKPNTYLASFAKFVIEHKHDTFIRENILIYAFEQYVTTHLKPAFEAYPYPTFLIGSIAYYNQDILKEILMKNGIYNVHFIQKPIDSLIQFHMERFTT